jgi:DNA-binding NarL/FixJ family response regulator
LIVEDQAYMRRTLRRFLESAFPGHEFHVACSGARALVQCRDHRPDVVLMDIELPDANGIELTAQIRLMLPDTAVIIVSNHNSAEHVRRALAAGAVAYVSKDAVDRDLIPSVKDALANLGSTPRDR